jgi:hypothetical protein
MNKVTLPKREKSTPERVSVWLPSNGREGLASGLWQNKVTGEILSKEAYQKRFEVQDETH